MNKDSLLYKVLRIVLFVVLAVIAFMLLYGIIKLVPRAISALTGGSSNTPATTLVVTSDKPTVRPGEPFKLSTTHTNTVSGKYILNYDCDKNVYFEFVTASSSERVTCNGTGMIPPFAIKQVNNQTVYEGILRPFYTDLALQSQTAINLKVSLISSSTLKVIGMGTTTISIVPSMATTTPPVGHGTSTPPTSGTGGMTGTVHHGGTSNQPVGSSDLFIKVIGYGTLVNGNTYISSQAPNYPGIVNGATAMQFIVSNHGPKATGGWVVSGTLPSNDPNSSYFTSALQPSLQTNDSVLFTLAFGGYVPGQYGSITADVNNQTQDINRANNSLTVGNFPTVGGGYINGNNFNPGYNPVSAVAPVYPSNSNYSQTNSFPYNSNPTYYSNHTTGAPADLAITATINNASRVSGTGGTVRIRITNIGGQSADKWSFIVYANGNRYTVNSTTYNVNGVDSGYSNGVYRSAVHDDSFQVGDVKTFDIELDKLVTGSSGGYNSDGTYNYAYPSNGTVTAQVTFNGTDANPANNKTTINY